MNEGGHLETLNRPRRPLPASHVGSEVNRSELERVVRSKLADYGVDATNFFIDWDLKTIVVICGHITGKMRLFMSKGGVSLGTVVRDSLVSAHRLNIGGERFGLMVVYCKICFDKGLKMMLGRE